MKKLILLLSALLIVSSAFADITIGTGTDLNIALPIEPYYGYTYSEVLYYQSEIAVAGDITELSWHFAGTSLSVSNDWTIYMGHTTKTSFASTTDWITSAGMTEVWSGTFTDPGAAGWITFDITDFTYDNTDNLVIAVDENASGYNGSGDDFYCSSTTNNRGLVYRSDSTNPDPASPPTATYNRANIANIILGGLTQACPPPTNPFTDTITETTANLNWTAGGAEPNWNIEWGLQGFTQGTGTMINNTTSNPYTLTGLTGATSYDWYVQADCDGTRDESVWVGPTNFVTACATFGVPFSETFDDVGLPTCWSMFGPEDWLFSTGAAYGASVAGDHTPGGGTNYAWVDGSGGGTNTGITLETPLIDVTSLTVPMLEFYLFSNNTDNPGDNNTLYVDFWDGAAWNAAIYTFSGDNPAWFLVQLDLSSYTITGDVQFRFIVDETASVAYYNDILVDDVLVDEMPTCPAPTNPYTDNITATSADLNWTAGGTEPNWNIEWGLEGFTQGTGTMINNTTSNPYTLTGLTGATSYDWYVQADCDGTRDESSWVGPITFMTLGTCDYTVELLDDYGDGWNGGYLDIYRNGTLQHAGVTLASGYGPEYTTIPANDLDILSFDYTEGGWGYENEYVVYDDGMVEVAREGAGGTVPGDIGDPGVPSGLTACPTNPLLGVSPSSYNFGAVTYGGCAGAVTFTISNIGGGVLTVTSVSLTGSDAGAFVLTDVNSYPASLPPDITVDVDFCPTAPGYYGDAYLTVVSVEDGTEDVPLSGMGVTNETPACPDNTIFQQLPNTTGWTAATSEYDPAYPVDYKVFDNYTVTENICDIHFWGLSLLCCWSDCVGDDPMTFLIEFWLDDGLGYPDVATGPIYTYTETWYGIPIMDIGGYILWQWGGDLDPCCDLLDGWVSVQGQTGVPDDCWFLWMNSPDGDAISKQWTDPTPTWDDLDYSLGLCLTGQSQCSVPTGVGIAVDQVADEVVISWNYVAGEKYYVYSDTDPYGSFATLVQGDILAGSWTITPIPADKEFYVVTCDFVTREASGESPERKYVAPKTILRAPFSDKAIDKSTEFSGQ